METPSIFPQGYEDEDYQVYLLVRVDDYIGSFSDLELSVRVSFAAVYHWTIWWPRRASYSGIGTVGTVKTTHFCIGNPARYICIRPQHILYGINGIVHFKNDACVRESMFSVTKRNTASRPVVSKVKRWNLKFCLGVISHFENRLEKTSPWSINTWLATYFSEMTTITTDVHTDIYWICSLQLIRAKTGQPHLFTTHLSIGILKVLISPQRYVQFGAIYIK